MAMKFQRMPYSKYGSLQPIIHKYTTMPRDRSKARELQERKKKGSVDELQLRLEKESEELKQSRLNQKAKIQRIKDRKKQAFLEKVEKDLPNLYLGIFVPCIMAVITICTATVATSIGGNGCKFSFCSRLLYQRKSSIHVNEIRC